MIGKKRIFNTKTTTIGDCDLDKGCDIIWRVNADVLARGTGLTEMALNLTKISVELDKIWPKILPKFYEFQLS